MNNFLFTTAVFALCSGVDGITLTNSTADPARSSSQQYEDFDVDVVYTWVGLLSADQIEQNARDCPNDEGGVQRWRDQGIFQVSLELMLKNLPWVRNVYIIVPSAQVPCWLDQSVHKEMDGRIHLVDHGDIFLGEDKKVLPVHCSRSIEAHMQNIDGLAEHFIYIQDDQMILNPVSKSSFFDVDGSPKLIASPIAINDTRKWSEDNNFPDLPDEDVPYFVYLNHQPCVWRKSWFDEIYKLWPDKIRKLGQEKCRAVGSTFMGVTQMMNIYGVLEGHATPTELRYYMGYKQTYKLNPRDVEKDPRHLAVTHVEDFFDKLRKYKPAVLVLEDDFETQDQDVYQQQDDIVQSYLDDIRPQHSMFTCAPPH